MSHSDPSRFAGMSTTKLAVVAAWFLATLGLGTWGYLDYHAEGKEPIHWANALYHAAQLFLLHAPHFELRPHWQLELARWSALAFTAAGIWDVTRQLGRAIRAPGPALYANHVVICGLGRRGLQCALRERARHKQVVIIDKAPQADRAAECAKHGIVVLTGDCRDPKVLDRARLSVAAELVALTSEDATNFEVARQARALLKSAHSRRAPLACDIHLSNVDLRVELQKAAALAPQGDNIAVRYFDLFDREARQLLRKTWPLDGRGIAVSETRRVHLVILGFGRMGRALAVRAAKLGHFANATRDPALRLQISVIEKEASRIESEFLSHYPVFRNACDLGFVADPVEVPATRDRLAGWLNDPGCLIRVAICFDDEARVMTTALQLRPLLLARRSPLALRLANPSPLEEIVGTVAQGPASLEVRPFGVVDERTCDEAFQDDPTERLAEEIHRSYRARQLLDGRSEDEAALQPWPLLAEPFRESNRQQADHIDVKLRALGCEAVPLADPRRAVERFEETEVDLIARMEHDRWNAERWLDGWTFAPPPKNESLRTSPHLVGWEALSPNVQDWDRGAVRAIPSHLRGVGLKICRVR